MLKQIAVVTILAYTACGFTAVVMADSTNSDTNGTTAASTNTNGNNGWGNGGGDGFTPGSSNGNGFGMTIGDHGSTRFHGVEGGTKSSPEYGR